MYGFTEKKKVTSSTKKKKIEDGKFASTTVSGKNHRGNAQLPNCYDFRLVKSKLYSTSDGYNNYY